MKNLLVIDGNNFAFRAAHSVYLSNDSGKNVSITFSMLNMIRSILEEHNPKQVCVCWDWHGSKKKEELYPQYKQNRKFKGEKEEWFIQDVMTQISELQKILPNFGLKQVRKERIEADDIIGILCEAFENVILVSSDRDLFQLIDYTDTEIFYPPKNMLLTKSNFEEVVGIHPSLYLYYRTLVGDTSDGIPGLKGFGDVTAKKLLKTFGPWPDWFNNEGHLRIQIIQDLNKSQRAVISSFEAKQILTRNYQLMKVGYLIQDMKDELIGDFNSQKLKFDEDLIKSFFLENQFSSYLARFRGWIHPFRMLVVKEEGYGPQDTN